MVPFSSVWDRRDSVELKGKPIYGSLSSGSPGRWAVSANWRRTGTWARNQSARQPS